ncbi:p-hydroxybenzoic acid efflux pump subunit AaeA [Paenibacillus konkukensis]|uniref:p-hydroxybenzoic acid efflux pump subunit AaeA n=1 Tax=Paenibacillus konkukensis TaxID=2020716 RepID=A0ABY4RFL5_9BACL|nr:HlyD family efflux transporter periplasmic adaptor subunit [Paenibacillus konkukensis]UQZ81053.1 p-hydroxybenzoic acid efflux pump subunit AaeA [Paenibacillus konkukensis]
MKKRAALSIVMVLLLSGCSLRTGSAGTEIKGSVEFNKMSAVSTVAGKIIEMNKGQGEPVKKGDILAVIDPANQKYAAEQLEAVVAMKKAKLEELNAGTRPEQIKQAQAQADAAKAQMELLLAGSQADQIEQGKANVSAAEESFNAAQITLDYVTAQHNRALNLYQEGQLSKEDLDSSAYKLNTTQKQTAVARFQLEATKDQLAQLEKGPRPQEISAATAGYEAAKAQLELLQSGNTKESIAMAQADLDQATAQWNQAKNLLEQYTIKALADGIITSKNVELGDVINIGTNLADIAKTDDIYVLCYVPDSYLDKISYNQPITITAGQKTIEGTVSYIALKHEYTPKDLQSNADGNHVTTKVKITIKGEDIQFNPGMIVTVHLPAA